MPFERCIRVISLPRGGHHAVKKSIFKTFTNAKSHNTVHKNGVAASKKDFLALQELQKTEIFSCYVYAMENTHINRIGEYKIPDMDFPKLETVVVIRDPYNWVASMLKGSRFNKSWHNVGQGVINQYKCYLRQALEIENYFIPETPIVVSYTSFVADRDYRVKIGSCLDLPKEPVIPDDIFQSSFVGTEKAKSGFNERWKSFLKNQQFLQVFRRDSELVKMSDEFFKFNPLRERGLL